MNRAENKYSHNATTEKLERAWKCTKTLKYG